MENRYIVRYIVIRVIALLLLIVVLVPVGWSFMYPGSRMFCKERQFNCYNGKICIARYFWMFCINRDIVDSLLAKYFIDGDYVVISSIQPWIKIGVTSSSPMVEIYAPFRRLNHRIVCGEMVLLMASKAGLDEKSMRALAKNILHDWQEDKESNPLDVLNDTENYEGYVMDALKRAGVK